MLSQLPCWADLTPEQYRERIEELVEEIEAEARANREARGVAPLGAEAILRQDPHTRPNQTKKSPAPPFHAASKSAQETFWEAYSTFVAAALPLWARDRSSSCSGPLTQSPHNALLDQRLLRGAFRRHAQHLDSNRAVHHHSSLGYEEGGF